MQIISVIAKLSKWSVIIMALSHQTRQIDSFPIKTYSDRNFSYVNVLMTYRHISLTYTKPNLPDVFLYVGLREQLFDHVTAALHFLVFCML